MSLGLASCLIRLYHNLSLPYFLHHCQGLLGPISWSIYRGLTTVIMLLYNRIMNGEKAQALLKALEDRRKDLGLQNQAFAEKLTISSAYWSYLQNGGRVITEAICGKVIVVFPWPDPLAELAMEALRELASAGTAVN